MDRTSSPTHDHVRIARSLVSAELDAAHLDPFINDETLSLELRTRLSTVQRRIRLLSKDLVFAVDRDAVLDGTWEKSVPDYIARHSL